MSSVWDDDDASTLLSDPVRSSASLHGGSSALQAAPPAAAADPSPKRTWRKRAATNFFSSPTVPDVYGSAKAMESQAEKAGWLWKQGSLSGFKKRWCLLLPPPTADGHSLDAASQDRWLVYYSEKSGETPNNVIVLPLGGYEVQATPPKGDRENTFRVTVTAGTKSTYSLAADTADGLFSWMESLHAGAQQSARAANASERLVQTAVANSLPRDVGGSGSDVDSSTEQDEALLRRLWAGFGATDEFAVKGERWKDFGFQRDDPVSDLRACGRLALLQLVYFVEHYPVTALTMCQTQIALDFTTAYPWATASVSVTRMLCMLMDLIQPFGVVAERRLARRNYWHLMETTETFHEVYCIMFECLDNEFKETGGTYMTFPVVLASMREKFAAVLNDTHSGESTESLRMRANARFERSGPSHRPLMYKADMFHLTLSTLPDEPIVFTVMMDRLIELGACTTEGVFRVPGDAAAILWMREEITRGENPVQVMKSCADLHSLASLFTRFLRELPEPLIPQSMYADVSALGQRGAAAGPDELEAFVSRLPTVNQIMARRLIAFLQMIDTGSTRMSTTNLAIVFVPSLVFHSDPQDMLRNAKTDQVFVSGLLARLPRRVIAEHETSDAHMHVANTLAAIHEDRMNSLGGRPPPVLQAAAPSEPEPEPEEIEPHRSGKHLWGVARGTMAMAVGLPVAVARPIAAFDPNVAVAKAVPVDATSHPSAAPQHMVPIDPATSLNAHWRHVRTAATAASASGWMIRQHHELAEEHRIAKQRAVAEQELLAQEEAELDVQLASTVAAAQQIADATLAAGARGAAAQRRWRVTGAATRVAGKVASTAARPLPPVAAPPALATVSWHEELVSVESAGESSSSRPTYSLAELVQPGAPPGVDASRKEDYLSEDDFLLAFGCSREQFDVLPKWKQKQLKRGAKLF